MYERELTGTIIAAAGEVHRQLGPGLLESIYELAMVQELSSRSLTVERQRLIPVTYKGKALETELRLDLLVNDHVIVELKSTSKIADIHLAQALTYLKLTGKKVCLIINFNVTRLASHGIRRVVLNPIVKSGARQFPIV